MLFLYALALYAAAGVIAAVAFVLFGVTQVQPLPVSIGARILLLPGAFALWPYVTARWLGAFSEKVDTGFPSENATTQERSSARDPR
jgi:hypothetical protein